MNNVKKSKFLYCFEPTVIDKYLIFSEELSKSFVSKRKDYIGWEETFMGMALLAAQRSKDPVTQVSGIVTVIT